MRTFLSGILATAFLLLLSGPGYGQEPVLGSTADFAVFTAVGAFSNTGATVVTGDVGTNVGAFTGFPPGTVIGDIHVADGASAQAATDVAIAYASFSTITCDEVIGTTLGSGQILTPGVYCLGGASTLVGELILDAEGDPDAIFIFKIDGALSTATLSSVTLINGASICNVYWQVNGQFEQGAGSTFIGTVVASGAIILLEGASLYGRALTTAGAVSLNNNTVTISQQPFAADISADGPVSFCEGGSVVLSGNVDGTWSTGATTPTITVSSEGSYYVTNTNDCGTDTSNVIVVTVNPLPICSITGGLAICDGGSTELCVTGDGSFLWSTGATTSCITVNTAGIYSVTITSPDGCESTCEVEVLVNDAPICSITGGLAICDGASTELCATGDGSYLWSTGATTSCITVNTAGVYSVTITSPDGCESTCEVEVLVNDAPICSITGGLAICDGGSTELCATGDGSYLWSTGATTSCITVNTAGIYSVTITSPDGCESICEVEVLENETPICSIMGDLMLCEGGSTELCATGTDSFLWSTGDNTSCINVNEAGIYSVTITSPDGCESICEVEVLENETPICSIMGDLMLCEGGSTELCATGTGSFLWSTGDNTSCINVNEAGIYSVTITSPDGCESICEVEVLENETPICSIMGDLMLCEGGSTELCATGTGSFLWSTGDNTSCINVDEAGIYSVTITSPDGCESICEVEVLENETPICSIMGDLMLCEGGSTELCATGTGSFLWSTGDNTSCINVDEAGIYSVTITSPDGCESICEVEVLVNDAPICSITGGLILCEGASTELCATGTGSYLWSTGAITSCINVVEAGIYSVTITSPDGCESICEVEVEILDAPVCIITGDPVFCEGGSTVLCVPAGAVSYLWNTGATSNCIMVNQPGLYSVTVTYAGGCESICQIEVLENETPICSIMGDLILCEGESTELCATGTGSFLWSTGEITSCINVDQAGIYSVTITSPDGCESICEVEVLVNDAPICSITGGLLLCEGASTELCATGTGSYLWSTGAITSCINVDEAGIYSVTITSPDGCESTCEVEVEILDAPVCIITGDPVFCEGGSTELCVPAGAVSYLWSNGETTNCITVSQPGLYSVTVTYAGGCESICQIEVLENETPICMITGGLILCEGESTELCATGTGSFLWSTGEITSCINVDQAGIYSVTITSPDGCESTCEVEVLVNDAPICMITGGLILCEGASTELCATGTGSYLWSTGAITSCINVDEAGIYSVTITSPDGCESTCEVEVEILDAPVCIITGDPVFCEGGSTELCVPAGAVSYLWSNGETTNCIMVNEPGLYSVTVTYAGGCESICQIEVLENETPICSIMGDLILCEGESTELCATGTGTYLWSTGEITSCINVDEAGIYSVTITSPDGCESTCEVEVIVNDAPICMITGGLILCEGASTELCATGTGSYLWSTGAITSCINVDEAGIYSVTITSPDGCESTCEVEVEILDAPVCMITGDPIFCEGGSTELCVPAGAVSYLWSNGETTNCIMVNEPGLYSVTVTYAGGCESICQIEVLENETPICSIMGDLILCEGESTELCATGTGSFLWSTGEITSCINVDQAGIYSVTITSPDGCESTCEVEVLVNDAPICMITGGLILCEGASTELCATGTGSYLWSTGATTSCITVNTAGIYSVTITSPDGCKSTCEVEVEILDAPVCIITGDPVFCEGGSTELCVPAGAVSYLWSNGETTNCIMVNEPGLYSVTVTYAGGCESICEIEVLENETPICSIIGDLILCEGESTELCATGTGSFLWSTGEITSCINVDEAGIYSVTITSPDGCESTCEVEVLMNDAPICSITGGLLLCEGASTELCATGTGSYLWSNGEITSCINVDEAGIYSVTITSPDGCESTCEVEVEILDAPVCMITGDPVFCEGGSTELCVPAGAVSYLWSNGETTNCIMVNEPGLYSVTVTYAGGCESICQIEVLENETPICSIIGDLILCEGESTELCATGTGSFLWSTGEITNCINVDQAGIYSVTITSPDGCESTCEVEVLMNDAPICSITGGLLLCEGASTELCATGTGSYLWSTGAITSCINVDEAGIYSVTITSPDGCESICEVEVETLEAPECMITGDPTFCVGGSTELCVPAGAMSYLWSNGETTNCIMVDQPGLYSVTVTYAGGCESICQIEVLENETPICSIMGDLILCEGESTELCATGTGSFLWSTGETTSCITVDEAGIYSVTITSPDGCESTCEVEVLMNDAPICSITGGLLLCEGASTELCATGTGSYLWSNGEITSCINVDEAGIYSVTITSPDGCESTCEVEVEILDAPLCMITGDPVFCEGGSTQLCVPAGAVSYLWSNGETTNCIMVDQPGLYSVTVTYAGGCESICQIEVLELETPICSIIGDLILCEGESTELCATGTGSFLWSTGEITNCINVDQAGIYSVTITSPDGCESTCEVEVIVNDAPICSITGGLILCEGASTELCATGTGSYLWSTGAITSCINVDEAGIYSVTITSPDGCESTCEVEVEILDAPVCIITGDPVFCEGGSTELCVPAGAVSYLWNTGATTNCITANTPGAYWVTVTYQDGCESICKVMIEELETPLCVITGNTTICEGGSTQLCVPAGALSYLWNTGATTHCITANGPGAYWVTVTYQDGCESICQIEVLENETPICSIIGDLILCEGESTELCATGTGSFLWSTGEITSCINVDEAGIYSVTITSPDGCESTCEVEVEILETPLCVITGNTTICEGGSTQLCVPAGALSYLWNTGATTNCITANAPGAYWVTVTYQDGCESICKVMVEEIETPVCVITGNTTICEGGSTQLCVPAGALSYLWNTGATTNCITANGPGAYWVTVTYQDGCQSICKVMIEEIETPVCVITGNTTICEGGSTELCVPAGALSYLWNTGATTNCITVNTPGAYWVTVTYQDGCESICKVMVEEIETPLCVITGNTTICEGGSTELCVPAGALSYLWNTGATTNCITVNTPGAYWVTVTYQDGCESLCKVMIEELETPLCVITGNTTICEGGSTELCVPAGALSYLWNTGATTNCITANAPGAYWVTVTYQDGCESLCKVMIEELDELAIVMDGICVANYEGVASVTVTTGGGGYQYLWSTNETTSAIGGLGSGTYTVLVTDASGCTASGEVTLVCKEDCPFRTQTMGGWGAPAKGNNPGVYRNANFAGAFPDGLTIGCINTLTLTSAAAVQAYLPDGGPATVLPSGALVDPVSLGNVLAGQLVALTLSVGFDAYDADFSAATTWLGDATINSGEFAGFTVSEILTLANQFIGGCPSIYTASQLNAILTAINENNVGGTRNNGLLDCEPVDVAKCQVSGSLSCLNPTVQLKVNNCIVSPGHSYQWTGPAGFSSTDQCPEVSVGGSYTVVVTNTITGVTGTCSVTVGQDNNEPEVSTADAWIACEETCTTLTATSTTAGVTFTWTGPSGFTASGASVEVCAAGIYTVTGTDPGNGCSDMATANVQVMVDCDCPLRTQTMGGWGAPAAGNNPGIYRDANFNAAFPDGLTIGCINTLTLTSAAAVQAYLPDGGPATVLPEGALVDPVSLGNVLAGQLVALTLSVGFDAYDPDFSAATTWLGDATINSGEFAGSTVSDILTFANQFIGGCPSIYTASQLNAILTAINENNVDGTRNNGLLDCEPGDVAKCQVSGSLSCLNPTVQLKVNACIVSPGHSYQWTGPAGFSSTDQCPEVSIAGSYTVVVTSTSTGVEVSCNVMVDQHIEEPGAVTADGLIPCFETCTTLTATSNSGDVIFVWNGPAGFTATAASIEVCAGGEYTVTVTDLSNGCISVATSTVTYEEDCGCQGRTQTMGGWGAPAKGNNPGVYRNANFAAAFPTGLIIGCTNTLTLTSALAVQTFLPSGGQASALPHGNLVDPTNYKNVLAGQLVALTLSLGFDASDPNFSSTNVYLGDMYIVSGTFAGWTVSELVAEANQFIGGCGSMYTASQLNNALSNINENFVDGTTDNGFLSCVSLVVAVTETPTKPGKGASNNNRKMLMDDVSITMVEAYPNPARDILYVRVVSGTSGPVSIDMHDVAGRMVRTIASYVAEEGEERLQTVPVEDVRPGVYTISVTHNDLRDLKRIIVTR